MLTSVQKDLEELDAKLDGEETDLNFKDETVKKIGERVDSLVGDCAIKFIFYVTVVKLCSVLLIYLNAFRLLSMYTQ